MNTRLTQLLQASPWVWAVGLCLLSGWTGFRLHDRTTEEVLTSSAGSIPSLDYLATPESFSRVDNARRNLEALCLQLRLEVQHDILFEKNSAVRRPPGSSNQAGQLARAIHDLERVLREFQGTEQEPYVVQDLLGALKQEGCVDRWTELYLKTLYEHPTHPVVSRLANEAIVVGRAAGREDNVLSGLRHLVDIPLEFPDKEQIELALLHAKPRIELSHAEPAPPTVGRWNPAQSVLVVPVAGR